MKYAWLASYHNGVVATIEDGKLAKSDPSFLITSAELPAIDPGF
jgi:hypothetical protein